MMNEKELKLKKIMEDELSCTAHNIDHVLRVYSLCIELSKYESNVDLRILIPSVLLHDIARAKESENINGTVDHAILGAEMSKDILKELHYNDSQITQIVHCISTHRYRTGNEPKTIEAKILFDADKLDSIGAIGVARTFMAAGQFGQSLSKNISIEEYKNNNTTDNGRVKNVSEHTPFIEYEVKLKKIPEKLYTNKAKEIGEQRLQFMKAFFDKLEDETNINIGEKYE